MYCVYVFVFSPANAQKLVSEGITSIEGKCVISMGVKIVQYLICTASDSFVCKNYLESLASKEVPVRTEIPA